MPRPRSQSISLDVTPYYHCISRCVRRAFLCGVDNEKSFEHRRGWIENRIVELSQVFSIDVCAYAVMSNHYHVVLHVDKSVALAWDLEAVFNRWAKLFTLPPLVEQYLSDPVMDEAFLSVVKCYAKSYRERLMDISWFMRTLNEPIARMANQEDGCTGRFWEGRFKSQALLDEAAVLTCMAYVDLNPVRATISKTPESSGYTSIKARIDTPDKADQLMPFLKQQNDQSPDHPDTCIPFSWADYLKLVDWTGRAIREDKRGFIDKDLPDILNRLHLDANEWLKQHHQLETHYPTFMGRWQQLQSACEQLHLKWCKGSTHSRLLFGT